MRNGRFRRLTKGGLIVLATLAVVLAGAIVTGRIAVVITSGVSMNPVYYQGDLVVVAKGDSYQIGQIAAYRTPGMKIVALHRIIGEDADGFVMKGDNNQSIDPYHPTADQIVGGAVLHVPGAGQWLQLLTSPIALGVAAFALVIFGNTIIMTRRRKRRAAMADKAKPATRLPSSVAAMPRRLQIALAVTATAAVLGLALAAFAWTAPTQIVASSTTQSGRAMTFSYSAEVPQSPAYDGTTVHSPDPVFRKLTNTVDVQLAYVGDPGSMTVNAELATPSGWHSTVPLSGPTDIGEVYSTSVTLDLKVLDARANAAAAATGLPADPLTVAVVATVKPADGGLFTPKLTLNLAPLVMSITGDPKVTDSATGSDSSLVPNTIGVGPFRMGVIPARVLSLVLLVGALAAAAALLVIARRTPPVSEVTRILQRYAPILATVQPIATPANVPVIEVSEFSTLAKLAERCGQLVLHWSRSDVETFVIMDEGTTYRYRISSGIAADEPAPAESPDREKRDLLEFDPS